jgi:hypothetical protein
MIRKKSDGGNALRGAHSRQDPRAKQTPNDKSFKSELSPNSRKKVRLKRTRETLGDCDFQPLGMYQV